jgi:hypothetical protein
MIRKALDLFLSINTTVVLLFLLIAFFFAGAFIMPVKKEFMTIHSIPLFDWLKKHEISITWWLWSIIIILGVLTLNTVACSIKSIIKKRKFTQWLLLISSQIIHIGFLFILLAHLLSSTGGFMGNAVVREGTYLKMPHKDLVLHIKNINLDIDSYGYLRNWNVHIEYLIGQDGIISDTIRPNKPSLKNGFNINVKDIQTFPQKALLLQVSRDPGATFALTGGILFFIGTIILIILKTKIEK